MALGEPHKPVEHRLTADENGLRPRTAALPGSRLDMSAHPTDFKWDETLHPRGAGGRFGEKPGAVLADIDDGKPAPVVEKTKPLGAKALIGKDSIAHDVLVEDMINKTTKTNKKQIDKMVMSGQPGASKPMGLETFKAELIKGTSVFTEEANRRIARNIRRVQVLGTVEKVQIAQAAGHTETNPVTVKAAAFYSSSTKTVVFGEIRADHVAHEFAHAVDKYSGPGGMGLYSGKEAWKKIWKEEIVDKAHGGIREYARTNEREGFACAFELAFDNPLSLKMRCPKTYAYLIKKKLLRNNLVNSEGDLA